MSPVLAIRSYANDIEPERPRAPRQGNEHKLGRTFQGQVMGSIGQRLQRERDQRERYEQWRHVTDPGRNWTLTFCESSHLDFSFPFPHNGAVAVF